MLHSHVCIQWQMTSAVGSSHVLLPRGYPDVVASWCRVCSRGQTALVARLPPCLLLAKAVAGTWQTSRPRTGAPCTRSALLPCRCTHTHRAVTPAHTGRRHVHRALCSFACPCNPAQGGPDLIGRYSHKLGFHEGSHNYPGRPCLPCTANTIMHPGPFRLHCFSAKQELMQHTAQSSTGYHVTADGSKVC